MNVPDSAWLEPELEADQLAIAIEEAYLVRRFGQPYCDYMATTRRWL